MNRRLIVNLAIARHLESKGVYKPGYVTALTVAAGPGQSGPTIAVDLDSLAAIKQQHATGTNIGATLPECPRCGHAMTPGCRSYCSVCGYTAGCGGA
jgi:hypothetical protein